MSAFDTEDKDWARAAFPFGANDIVLPSLFGCFVAIVHSFNKFLTEKRNKSDCWKEKYLKEERFFTSGIETEKLCGDCLEAFSLKSFFDCTYRVLKIGNNRQHIKSNQIDQT